VEPSEVSLLGLVGWTLADVEKMFIAGTLRVSGGNRELAASKLGIGERTLYRMIKEYEL
jgi:two-component system, NtrC family, response regulator HydG